MQTRDIGNVVGRAMMSAIFIASGIGKFGQEQGNLDYMASKGLPRSRLLLRLAGLAEVSFGAGLLTGVIGRPSAAGLGLFLVPVTYFFHDFWKLEGAERQNQMAHFFKNLALMGGLIQHASFGGGAYSGDRLVKRVLARRMTPIESLRAA